jgi:4-amino-4-deoxy-L-arabinose transferase-like glycosyltransferase
VAPLSIQTESQAEPVRRWEILGLAGILLVYAVALTAYFVPTLGGPDANSYHVSARMLEQHGRFHQVPEDDLAFVGRMWVEDAHGRFYSKYPPLYPALSGILMRLFGDMAGMLVAPVCSWLAVLGTFVLVRALLPGWPALLGALATASNPLFNIFAADQVSHAASIACLTWGFALFFHGAKRDGRPRDVLLLGSGLLLGYAVGIRYPNLLLLAAPMLWFALGLTRSWRAAGAWLAGLAVPGLLLAWFHWSAFGSPLRTGYSLTDEQQGFALSSFAHNLRFYFAFMGEGVGPLFVLSLCGFVTTWRRDWRRGAFFTVWLLPLALLYVSYYYLPALSEGYLRFLLPLVAPCTLLALVFAREAVGAFESTATRRLLIGALVACQAAWGVIGSIDQFELRYAFNDMQHEKVQFIREQVPAGSELFGPVWLLDALDYHRSYTLRDQDLLFRDRLSARVARVLSDVHVQHTREARWNAELVGVDEATYRGRIRALIDQPLAAGRSVFAVGTPEDHAALVEAYSERYEIEQAAVLPRFGPRHRIFAPVFHAPLTSAWEDTVITKIRPRS